ncbi:MAG: NAD-dependent epimerase/dehydratase family protein [Myxococcales bacterium]|nr:NAD-dependent epimerase/dehydratase family protein [Myxococcales bacterium]
MKVLVTGASGFLGSHVVERLKARGDSVRALVRRSSNTKLLEKLEVELAYGAIDQHDTLPAAVEDVDAIIHCAGLVKARDAEEFDAVNHKGSEALALAAIEHNPKLKRFVHVSSAAVMGPGETSAPRTRDSEPNPVTEYGRSKLRGERAVIAVKDKLPVTVLRPPAIYGPRDQEMFAFFQMVSYGLAMKLGGGFDNMVVVYGEDCADACIAAIDKDVPSGNVYFVHDGTARSFDAMADAIARALDVETWARPIVPLPVLRVAARVSEAFGKATNKAMMFTQDKVNELAIKHFDFDTSATRDELGWSPRVDFEEGTKITARWYRENRWL